MKGGTLFITICLIALSNCGTKTADPTPIPTEVAPDSISLNVTEVTLELGTSLQLTYSVSPQNINYNLYVFWRSSDDFIVGVNANGQVFANKVGTATITVSTNNNKTSSCIINVILPTIPVTSINFDNSYDDPATFSYILDIGDSRQLVTIISPQNATNKSVKWESSDQTIASISADGVVTALKIGDAVIKVTSQDGDLSASVQIKVRYKLKTIVTDLNDKPLSQATVLAFDPITKTYIYGQTNNDGLCILASPVKKTVTILVAHPEHKGEIITGQMNNDNLIIKMTDGSYGSVLAPEQTCNIIGLSGRLNPIKDNLDRLYLYADNISINNGMAQPVTFDLTNSLNLEDALGKVKTIWIPFADGKTSLINYQPQ